MKTRNLSPLFRSVVMKTSITFSTIAVLLGITGLSYAAQVTSPLLPTGTGTSGACYIRNVGSSPISLQATIFQNVDFPVIVNFQNCNNAPLPAGRTCVVLVNDLPDDVFFSCSAVVSGSAKNLRGTVEVRDISPTLKVLAAEELR